MIARQGNLTDAIIGEMFQEIINTFIPESSSINRYKIRHHVRVMSIQANCGSPVCPFWLRPKCPRQVGREAMHPPAAHSPLSSEERWLRVSPSKEGECGKVKHAESGLGGFDSLTWLYIPRISYPALVQDEWQTEERKWGSRHEPA